MSAYYIVEPPEAATPATDYSTVYGNISTYLNQIKTELSQIDTDTTASTATLALIAVSLATLAANSTTTATNTTIIAEKQTAMEAYQKKLKELGETTGIRSRGPFETWGNISTYKYLIEQAKILDETNKASPDLQERALQSIQDYLTLINEKGKEF